MARVRVVGKANYDGAVGKSFDVIVEISEPQYLSNGWGTKCREAILAKYPSWSSVICENYNVL